MFNKVVLVGNLTRDIELRYAQNGNAIGNTAIAVTRKFSVNGEKREETCFVDITFFSRQAEVANQYLKKGSKLLIEGRLKFDQWQDQNGQNRSKHSIVVENMEMLGSNSSETGGYNQQNQNYNQNSSYNQNSNYNQNYNSYNSNNKRDFGQKPQYVEQNKQNFDNDFEDDIPDIDVDKYDIDDEKIPF